MSPPLLYFTHVSEAPDNVLRRIPPEAGTIQWIFLGQDYSRFLEWQKAMPASDKPIAFKQELDYAVESLSRPFSDVITRLGRIYDSPAWWACRISEKNNLVSPLFLHCCYLHVWNNLINQLQGNVVIVGEDPDLLIAAQKIVGARGSIVKRITGEGFGSKFFAYRFKALGRIAKFLLRSFSLWMAGAKNVPLEDKKDIFLIHTYVDEACLSPSGEFKDRYFPGLSQWLNKKGHKTITLPVMFNIRRSYQSVWQWLRQAPGFFLNPFRYYSVTDYAFVIRESFRQQRISFKDVKIDGVDVSYLFGAEQKRQAFGCLDALLYYCLPLRLKEAGFRVARVIMPFENMIDEKLFNLGLKKFSQETYSVGFQHSALYPRLMCQFVSSEEALFAPLPDKIVCSGRLFCDILADKGMPKQKLEIGPALRYSYLSHVLTRKDQEKTSADILIPLPLMESDAIELLIKVLGALKNKTHLRVVVKPHPMMKKDWLLQMLNKLILPTYLTVEEGSMEDQLRKVRLVIGMSSCVLMEVFVAGKPVIVVGRNTAIDFNPLGFLPGMDQVCVTSDDINRLIEEILKSDTAASNHRQFSAQVFSPVTDELMEMFLRN